MMFLSIILIFTALWTPVYGYIYDYPTVLLVDYYGDPGVVVGGGFDPSILIGLLALISVGGSLIGGIGGIGGAAPCPGAACSTAVGCAAGYTELTIDGVTSCYVLLNPAVANFLAAQASCTAVGGSLASISSANVATALRTLVPNAGAGADLFYTGVRTFAQDEPVINICSGQTLPAAITPAQGLNQPDCIVLQGTSAALLRNDCTMTARPLCEQAIVNTCTCTASLTG